MEKSFDLIVFGATGFTGRLVAEYLYTTYGAEGPPAWALAGRSPAKLAGVRRLLGAPDSLPLLAADATDPASLARLVALVMACARAGTDYVDLCGEPGWMAEMIPRLDGPARESGARIVFSCGFDSIPFDLGVTFLQEASRERFDMPLSRVRGRVSVMKGGFSGGTAASLLATLEARARDPALARTLADPFALTPGFRGPPQPEGDSAAWDEAAQSWTGPFVMAPINTKNVHRTNALRGHPWGRDFVYDERMLTGDGDAGKRRAKALERRTRVQDAVLGFAPTRALVRRFVLPAPGRGPSRHERETGRYEVVFIGDTADGRRLRATVAGDRDPGYGSTSKLVAESALCLLDDVDRSMTAGGVWTPGAAMGMALVRRLQARAGLHFSIDTEDTP
jgi:short subunit dehydrogenase-like uncharacterized protein